MKKTLLIFHGLIPLLFLLGVGCLRPGPAYPPIGSDGVLFCFWNVENLFDDQLDLHESEIDRPYDAWFAEDSEARRLKYRHIAQALLRMNDNRGPDILALVEVESLRAAELLRTELNEELREPSLYYGPPQFEAVTSGRHMAPAILARVSLACSRTHLLDANRRILETHVHSDANELIVLASHWTSHVTDADGHEREKYAKLLYGRYNAIYQHNPAVDLLVAGDFNDSPDADGVLNRLHAHGNRDALDGAMPSLFNLMAGKSAAEFGTHYHRQMAIYDQIAVSPGLLDGRGWTCDIASIQTVNDLTADSHGHPRAFGNRHHGPRGWSDHFPVAVRLRTE